MSKHRMLSIFLHAGKMVGRTLKSYALLSVTIVLTFSLFFGYLLYTDSSAYNEYKETFYMQRGHLYFQAKDFESTRLATFLQKAEELAEFHTCIVYEASGGALEMTYEEAEYEAEYGETDQVRLRNWQIAYLPDHAFVGDVYYFDNPYDLSRITWLDGQEHTDVTLAKDEALLPEQLYYALGLDRMEEPEFIFRFNGDGMREEGDNQVGTMTLKIVGLLKDDEALKPDGVGMNLNTSYVNRILVSARNLTGVTPWDRTVYIHTDAPEVVDQLAKSLGYYPYSVYEQQNEALAQMRYQMGSKAVVAAALLLLLGINLYSCFTNVLNDRKFEIGVKRAVGASAWSIVRQFVYESLIVITANIILSVALVTDIFIIYKFIYERIPDDWGNFRQWTIYISPYSGGIFLVCSVTLAVVFSLIFAYKSTKVEIVKYLKAE